MSVPSEHPGHVHIDDAEREKYRSEISTEECHKLLEAGELYREYECIDLVRENIEWTVSLPLKKSIKIYSLLYDNSNPQTRGWYSEMMVKSYLEGYEQLNHVEDYLREYIGAILIEDNIPSELPSTLPEKTEGFSEFREYQQSMREKSRGIDETIKYRDPDDYTPSDYDVPQVVDEKYISWLENMIRTLKKVNKHGLKSYESRLDKFIKHYRKGNYLEACIIGMSTFDGMMSMICEEKGMTKKGYNGECYTTRQKLNAFENAHEIPHLPNEKRLQELSELWNYRHSLLHGDEEAIYDEWLSAVTGIMLNVALLIYQDKTLMLGEQMWDERATVSKNIDGDPINDAIIDANSEWKEHMSIVRDCGSIARGIQKVFGGEIVGITPYTDEYGCPITYVAVDIDGKLYDGFGRTTIDSLIELVANTEKIENINNQVYYACQIPIYLTEEEEIKMVYESLKTYCG